MHVFSEHPHILKFESFSCFEKVLAFSTTRLGGCSEGSYDSFNLSYYSGDDPVKVAGNRALLCKSLGVETDRLFVPYQTHEAEIATIDEAFLQLSSDEQEKCLHGKDALVTACRPLAIAVTTADCVPILLYDKDKGVAAAIHAGWRGTCLHIVDTTIRKMIEEYSCLPGSLYAAIGPAISVSSFEVGEEVRLAFEQAGFEMEAVAQLNPATGKTHIDLWEANRREMIRAGIPSIQIQVAGLCTLQTSEAFFSARKLGVVSGRMLTGICLI